MDPGVAYTVVTRYNVGTGQTTLWINPASENDSGATATDSSFPFTVETYSFRENSGIGDMSIDDVKVGTSFSDVVQVGPAMSISRSGDTVTVTWGGTGTLQYADDLTSPPASINWVSIDGAPNPYPTSASAAAHRFYRVTVP